MIILDTCVLIFDALSPERLSPKAARAIKSGEHNKQLACSDISLWEIAMLMKKGRLYPATDYLSFMRLVLQAREIQVLSITPEIANISAFHKTMSHQYPADRIIAATAIAYNAGLVTPDRLLQKISGVKIIW